MNPQLPYKLRKRQLISLIFFGVLIISSHFIFAIYKNNHNDKIPNIKFETELKPEIILSDFDPNKLDENGWKKLGFSDRQIKTILKYKTIVGGKFSSKQQLKKCYAISEEKFNALSPFILLPENNSFNNRKENHFEKREKAKINHYFDPNQYNTSDWQAIGFTERQAQVIVNYRDKNLRGSFKSLEDIQKCFVISDEKYAEIKPWIRLSPQQTQKQEIKAIQQETDFSKIDINEIKFKQLQEFGFTEKDSAMLLSFRKKLGGFMTKQQVLDTYEIDKSLAEKLINTCLLKTENIQRYRLSDAPEEWLKSHPYFKYSADKIIFYRTSYPDDKKIWKYLKLKPIYEERMRLYTINE